MTSPAFEDVLVTLDLTEIDDVLIERVSRLSESLGIKKVYFLHVEKDLTPPKSILSKYPDLHSPLDEKIQHGIKDKVDKLFTAEGVEVAVEVREGDAFEKILRFALVKEVDLIVLGRKQDSHALFTSRIARKSPCSLMLIPEQIPDFDGPLLVATDFSPRSTPAIQLAQNIFSNLPGCAGYKCVHIYEVHFGYSKIGKTREEFSQIMKENAQHEWSALLNQNGIDPKTQCEFIDKKDGESAKLLAKYAEDNHARLLIVGSKGHTDSASILLGSFTEKLTVENQKTPLLIIKSKGETITFLQALLRL